MTRAKATVFTTPPERTRGFLAGVLFVAIYLLLGLYRLGTVLVRLTAVLLFRMSLTILVYSFLGIVMAAALILIGASWLIACSGGQLRLP